MASDQQLDWADVSIKFTGNTLADTAGFNEARKLLITYVGKSTQTGAALGAQAITSMTPPELGDPTPSDDIDSNFAEQQRFKLLMESVARDKREWHSIKSYIFHAVWARSAKSMQEKLSGLQTTYERDGTTIIFKGYDVISLEQDGLSLLLLMRSVCHGADTADGITTYQRIILDMDMFAGGQRTNESIDDYGRRLRQNSETHRAAGGSLGLHHPALYTAALANIAQEAGVAVTALSAEQQASAVSKVEREYLASLVIVLADERRYGGLKSRLKLEHKLQGTNNYPTTVTQALKMLSDWESVSRDAAGTARGGTSSLEQSLAFAQTGGPFNEEKKDDGDVDPNRGDNDTFPPPPQDPGELGRYFAAHQHNSAAVQAHWAVWDGFTKTERSKHYWPARKKALKALGKQDGHKPGGSKNESVSNANIGSNDDDAFEGIGFAQNNAPHLTLDPNYVYLDSMCSDHSAFTDEFLSDVRTSDRVLRTNTNAGSIESNKVGQWRGFEFHLNTGGIANLLSIPRLEEAGCTVDYSTDGEWTVKLPSGEVLVFKRDTGVCNRMPYIDVRELGTDEAVSCVQTVRKNFEGLTKRQVEGAILAGKLQASTGHLTDERFRQLSLEALRHE